MERGGEVHDHTKSGQLRQGGRNWIKTEPMMMMMRIATRHLCLLFYWIDLFGFCQLDTCRRPLHIDQPIK